MKMTREEAIETLGHVVPFATQNGEKIAEAIDLAIEALKNGYVVYKEYKTFCGIPMEEAIEVIEKYKEQITPTIPMFKESEEAYKAWTGEEMGGDEIDEMNREIIKDILKTIPTAYLLEALGVSTFEELTEQADRPHGEWIHDTHYGVNFPEHKCSICGEWEYSDKESDLCPNCHAKMGGDTK